MSDIVFNKLDEIGFAILLEWFQDPELQRWVDLPTQQWLDYVTRDPNAFAWLIWENDQPLGHLQLDIDGDHIGSLSLVVHPKLRGQGIGRRILGTFLSSSESMSLCRFEAWIDVNNISSIRCFEAVGFVAQSKVPDAHGLLIFTYDRPECEERSWRFTGEHDNE